MSKRPNPGSAIEYEFPALLTGRIYELGAQPPKLLFTFKRSATRSGSAIHVLREFRYPNGTLAARETVQYEQGSLASYELDEPESGARGKAVIRSDPNHPGRPSIFFEYTPASGVTGKKKTNREAYRQDTLINDMVAPFIKAHWDKLMEGAAVKFRFVALPRAETVGFKLVKEYSGTLEGKPVVRLRMEPTSMIIQRLVAPVFFTVEREQPHRILQYVGRTTPRLQVGKGWKDLDALTVFDWR